MLTKDKELGSGQMEKPHDYQGQPWSGSSQPNGMGEGEKKYTLLAEMESNKIHLIQ